MTQQKRDGCAAKWTDDELRKQLKLVFWEHSRIPMPHRNDMNQEYAAVIDWYKTVCAEFRNRKMDEELNETVKQYRNRHQK